MSEAPSIVRSLASEAQVLTQVSKIALVLTVAALALDLPRSAHATPSTTFWAPSTPYVQQFGVLHVTYDTYFRSSAAYPIDVGLTIGVLPWKGIQAEVGFDLLYPTNAGGKALDLPLVVHGKVGTPEDAYFDGQPAVSFGIFGVGFEDNVTNQNVLYGMIGKTFPYVGVPQIGVYYALNGDLFRSASGEEARFGLLAGWFSPPIHVPVLDKIVLAWDIQTGHNALGATGGGVYLYMTPAIDLLTGPVFFFEKELQPGASSWMWTVQLDIDIDLLSGSHAAASQ